jgi:proliferating cell nuclear antigen
MFEARLPQGGLMKKILEALKDLVINANWDLSSEGMSLQAMDQSHVSLVSVLLNSAGFEDYRCDTNCIMGISLPVMTKVMRCCNNDDSLKIEYKDDPGDTVTFTFESPNQERTSEFNVKLMTIDSEHLALTDDDHDSCITMPSGEFQRICRDLSAFGEAVTIAVVKNSVTFKASGDLGEGNITLLETNTDKEDEKVQIEMENPVALTFAIKYLNMFCRGAPLSPLVKLTLKNESPLIVEYTIADIGNIRYFLAPKVSDEDEN